MQDPASAVPKVVNLLLTGSSKERRAALEQNFARDAVLVHPFFVVYGRDAIYWIYEGWSLLNRRRVTYTVDTSVASPDGSQFVCDGWTHINPFLWAPFMPVFHLRIISFVTLAEDKDGRRVITKQHDTHVWLGSIARNIRGYRWLYEDLYREVCGAVSVFFFWLVYACARILGFKSAMDAPPPAPRQVAGAVLGPKAAAILLQDGHKPSDDEP